VDIVRYSGDDERLALVGMCLNTQVLAAVASTWQPEVFSSRWSNVVAGWCVRHYNQFKEAPGQAGITAMFADWARSADKDTVDIVGKLVGSLDPNSLASTEYTVELIAKIGLRNSTRSLAEKIQGALANGKIEEAAALSESWRRPQVGVATDGVFLAEDDNAIDAGYDNFTPEPLIAYPGALGKFFGPMLSRDSFIAFLAPSKRGKSTWLIELAWRGILAKKRVVYISLGDMSQAQVVRRFLHKAAKNPVMPGSFRIPTGLTYEGKEPRVEYREHYTSQGMTKELAKIKLKAALEDDTKRLRVVCKGAATTTAGDIAGMIERWADQGWVPDIVVTDYADIMAGLPSHKDQRERINYNWMEMRATSTRFHCLYLTATQADTAGMDAWLLGPTNFNGDRRILDHPTGVVGINATLYEKKMGVTRFNWVVLREEESQKDNPSHICGVAGNMVVGCPAIISEWVK